MRAPHLLAPSGWRFFTRLATLAALHSSHLRWCCSRGYWINPAATSQAFDVERWFHTRDLERCDENGFFYIAGRTKDMIISGGVNIYPGEIEKELLAHPAIAEVCVIRAGNEKWGEVPVAFAALKPGASVSELELIEFLRPRISEIILPRQANFIAAMPPNAYGKVLKHNLQDRLRDIKLGTAGEGHSASLERMSP